MSVAPLRLVTLASFALFAGCSTQGAPAAGETPAPDEVCAPAEERLGHRVCVVRIPNRKTWKAVTYPQSAIDQLRATTYLVPARENARLAPLFVDASAFDSPEQSLHFKLLTSSFNEFETLEYPEYLELITDARTREWFAGGITEFVTSDEGAVIGFYVWDDQSETGTVRCADFDELYQTVEERTAVGPVRVVPTTDFQREVLASCDVPSYDPSQALDYEVYTRASGCGTVRRYTLSELAVAESAAEFGFQDILVVAEAPLDVARVVSGVITGTRQGELSHVNVRSASRGTPNCYVKNAYDLFERWQGQLVRVDCGASEATVIAIDQEEAERCWDELRPDPVEIVLPDLAFSDFVGLLDLPTATLEERRSAVARYGAKGSNLATLYQRIPEAPQFQGFLIPLHRYDQFLRDSTWTHDFGDGPSVVSFGEALNRFFEDEVFLSDGAIRTESLLALQSAMREAPCDSELDDQLADWITRTWGGDGVMVRFRSSSNAEDALGFNGAGLYDSTSVCVADDLDQDDEGPSRCDPDEPDERGVCRGLRKVWASLWNAKAYEERDFYGIDHRDVGMGILVNTRTKEERANIVVFSENPLVRGDSRMLINAQAGELDVVAAVPGVWPEKDLLTLEQGEVVEIERERGSTELPEGERVLSDAELERLGRAMWEIAQVFPLDESAPVTARVILDTEWKFTSDGELVIKQIRPFLDE